MTRFRRLALLAAVCLLFRVDASAQVPTYTLAVRNVALADALERFVDATGVAVSYEPSLVRGHTTSCAAEDKPAEAVLRCILRDSDLDFYRLSSGTYVLTESVELAPALGYLAGRVVDRSTGSPLAGAHVQLADAGLAAVTDRSGRFALPALLPGSYLLTVSHLGYRPWSDSLNVAPHEQVQAEAELQSEPIFITPLIIDGVQAEPSAHGRPTTAASSTLPASPYDALPALPGVRLSDVTADVHVQGGDAGAHQLRIDGVPVFLPWSIAGFVGPFSSLALDRITVHKAGFGAAQGSHLGGVLTAEHALASVNDFDVQADPYSLNARARLAQGSRVAGMVAARLSLWDIITSSRLQTTLDRWSRPDPFLLLAGLTEDDGALDDIPSLLQRPVDPSLHYSDVHAAGRVRFGPLRSVHASFYQGRQRMGGRARSIDRNLSDQEDLVALSVFDSYDWINTLGQVRYDAVLGARTLAGIQVRASRYRLKNSYETLDSLSAQLRAGAVQFTNVSATPAGDENSVSTLAIEGTLDHAAERHRIQAGIEAGLLGSRFDLQSVYFPDDAGDAFTQALADRNEATVSARQGVVRNESRSWYAAAFSEDRVSLSSAVDAEVGVRVTYVDARQTVYAEPRAALLYGGSSPFGTWSARTAAGLYRQYLNQTDASKLNAGALLPSVRIWLPVDASVRPAASYHLAQELLLQPGGGWAIRLDGYVKRQPHGLALAYAQADTLRFVTGRVDQSALFVTTKETTVGGMLEMSWKASTLRASARYSYERSVRQSGAFFGGREHPAPWSEPHRVEAALDWRPAGRLALSVRWEGVWQRPWGFRKVYYDYFGHGGARRPPPYDLGSPENHVLPPVYRLDLSAAYTEPVGKVNVQLRAEVLNVLDRENVLDWRLVDDGSRWRKEETHLYPIMPSFAVRIQGF